MLEPVATEEQQQLTLPLRPDPEAPQDSPLVVLVGDAEPPPQTGCCRMVTEQGEAEPVQGPPRDLLGVGADLAPQPRGDLVAGAVGEGEEMLMKVKR